MLPAWHNPDVGRDDFADFDELGRELRRSVGDEFRRAAEDDEIAASKVALRRRNLEQVAYELLARGDVVAVTCGAERFTGRLVHAHGDLATMHRSVGGEVHINLAGPVMLTVEERATEGGKGRDRFGPESFIARLRQLELDETDIEIVTIGEGHVAGRIGAVATDHVMVLSEGRTAYVPITTIAAVMPY